MASPSLALPGVLFVGEDERARLVAHLGPAAGWMIPKGVLGWSHEVSVVLREALTEDVRRDAKIVMPEEQIPQARMPLTYQAAAKSPLVAVSSRLTQKLVDAGIRVHTVGADRVTSSFYYIGEGGTEPPVRVEGDLVAAVGAMLGERADNAAIERVLDGLVDRLVRSLSKDRVTELALELAAALPRASADGTGLSDVDLESFEKDLATLVAASEKYQSFLQEIGSKIADTNERKVEIPLFVDARKSSQGPFDLSVGEQKVALGTHDRWFLTGPLTEPVAKPAPAPKAEPAPAPKPAPAPAAAVKAPAPSPSPKAPNTAPKPAPSPGPAAVAAKPAPTSVGNIRPLAAPLNPPRPASTPPKADPAPETPRPAEAPKPAPVPKVETPKPVEPVAAKVETPKPAEPVAAKAETPKPAEPVAAPVEAPKPEPVVAAPKAEAPKVETPKAEAPKAKAEEPSRAVAKAAEASPAKTESAAPPAKKGGGFPILLVVVALALAFAAYRFLVVKH